MKKNHYPLYLLLVFFLACSTDDEVAVEPSLVEYDNILNYGTGDAEMAFSAIGLEEVHPDIEHRFKVYEVIYKTSYRDQEIEASALVAIPNTDVPMPIISFQHGTIVAHDEAPSKNLLQQLPLFSLASTGYIVVIPEFIGFGASEEYFHPYYIADVMGESIYRAIQATLEILPDIDRSYNGDLFLAGYSEGGYATMAAHKYIEENTGMSIKASAPASGGYNVKAMQEYFFELETYNQPFYMAFVAMAYKNYYGWNEDMDLFFQEPYASKMETLFNGSYSGSQINAELTSNISELIQPEALENFDVSADYEHMVDAFYANSLTNWQTESPIFMYHGTADITVPFENSVLSYDELTEIPANTGKIEFIPLEGGTHSSGAIPYVKDLYFKFKALK